MGWSGNQRRRPPDERRWTRVDGEDDRKTLLARGHENKKGVGCSQYFTPIHLQPFYVDQFGFKEGDFPACEALASRTVALPFHGTLTEAQIDRVCAAFTSLL